MNDKHPLRKEKYENFKKAASLPFGKRVAYYLNFFKFWVGGIVVIGIIIYFYLSQVIFAPKIILNGYIVNRTEIPVMTDEEFMSSFPGYSKINQRKESGKNYSTGFLILHAFFFEFFQVCSELRIEFRPFWQNAGARSGFPVL